MSEISKHPSVWPNFLPGQPVARRAPEGDTLIEPCDDVRDHVSLGSSSIIHTPSLTELLESQVLPKRTPASVAWEALGKCRDLPLDIQRLCADFCRYMDMCENTGFKANGFRPSGNNNGLIQVTGPLLNRWHPRRRSAWVAKLHELTQWYLVTRPGCTMISLTGYQDGLSIYQTWDSINSSREKLLMICRKYLGKFDYLWVVEPHTEKGTGYPHYHLVVFKDVDNTTTDSNGEGMEDKLRRLYSDEWKTGSHTYGLDFKVLSGNEGIKNLKNYLMKYISKGYLTQDGWGKAELIFNAHLWGASHGYYGDKLERNDFNEKKIYRLIGMSRHLSKMLAPEKEEDNGIVWLYIDETEPIEFKNDRGEIEEDLDCKNLWSRQLIPDWLLPFRELKPHEEWQERIVDEKMRLREARRLRELRDNDWSD